MYYVRLPWQSYWVLPITLVMVCSLHVRTYFKLIAELSLHKLNTLENRWCLLYLSVQLRQLIHSQRRYVQNSTALTSTWESMVKQCISLTTVTEPRWLAHRITTSCWFSPFIGSSNTGFPATRNHHVLYHDALYLLSPAHLPRLQHSTTEGVLLFSHKVLFFSLLPWPPDSTPLAACIVHF